MSASYLLRLVLGFLISSDASKCLRDSHALSRDSYKDEIVGLMQKTANNDLLQSVFEVVLAQNCVDPPDSCPNENITFWLFTSKVHEESWLNMGASNDAFRLGYSDQINQLDALGVVQESTQENPSIIDVSNGESLKKLKYGKEDPWKLILHGYTGHRDYSPNSELRPAYFQKGDYNIISIDYGPLVKEPCYLQAVFNVPLVANCTAYMIDRMVEEGIFRLEQLHVIGFSLGGQVSGHLSRFVKSGKLKRITGLDPALPLFIGNALGKLDETDAEFVDVIHTDAGRKGKLERSGHVDFYPNGGYSQIGCIDMENFTLSGCNHVRASYYYAESITSEIGFWGIPCNTYLAFYWGWCKAEESDLIIMGEYTPPTAKGAYYLETNKFSPYALGKKLKVEKPEKPPESEEPRK